MSQESHCFRVDETLHYVKDSLEHLSDNDELFVSNRNDVKAAPNMSVFRINLFLVESEVLRIHDNDAHDDTEEINDSTRTLDLSYEVVTK